MELLRERQKVVQGVDFQWSSDSWTHNIFRVYELLFGRAYGKNGVGDTIRHENSTIATPDGVFYACHTWESCFALIETYIRQALQSWKPVKIRISIPVLQTPQGFPVFASPYIFAVAIDATSMAENILTISTTFSHTSTGSNLILISTTSAATNNANQTVSTITYNAIGSTVIEISNDSATISRITELWYLIAPNTGANNVVVTYANEPSDFFSVGVATYTGAKQTGQPDASGKAVATTNVLSLAKSITTVDDNCWIVGGLCNQANGTLTAADSGTLLRQSIFPRVAGGYELFQLDSNAAKTPAGAYSTGASWTGLTQANIVVASIAPAAAAAGGGVNRNFNLLGVGT